MHKLFRFAIAADKPLLMWGAPGIGKTAFVEAEAARLKAHLEVLIGSNMDPTEVGGVLVPGTNGSGLMQEPPPWAVRVRAALDSEQETWLFLDELNTAPRSVQAALLRVVQNRQVAGLDLTGCKIIAAANPPELVPDGITLAAATANRWIHVDQEPDPIAWADGMASGWGKPQSTKLAAIRGTLGAYIRKNTGALLVVPEDIEEQGRAWRSPRSWDNLSALLAELPKGLRDINANAAAVSLVGASGAEEFMVWLEQNDLPEPADMLRHPQTCDIPPTRDRSETALHSCVAYVMSMDGTELVTHWDALWTLIHRVPKDVALSASSVALRLRKDGKDFLPVPDYVMDLNEALQAAS